MCQVYTHMYEYVCVCVYVNTCILSQTLGLLPNKPLNHLKRKPLKGSSGKYGLGVQNEAGQRLIEFCQENALVITDTLFQQNKIRLYTWTSPDGQHQNQTDSILCSQRWRHSLQSAKTKMGADCGSDHELLIAKFRLQLKKVGRSTTTFRYDLNPL